MKGQRRYVVFGPSHNRTSTWPVTPVHKPGCHHVKKMRYARRVMLEVLNAGESIFDTLHFYEARQRAKGRHYLPAYDPCRQCFAADYKRDKRFAS